MADPGENKEMDPRSLPQLPPGQQFLVGADGAYLVREDGSFITGKISETDARQSVSDALTKIQAALNEIRAQSPLMGHNNPPDGTESTVSVAEQAASEVAQQLEKSLPDKNILQQAKEKFEALGSAAKTASLVGAGAIGHKALDAAAGSVWEQLEPHIWQMVEALKHWIAVLF